MTVVSIKLPDDLLLRLRAEARATGRTVSALIRERLETAPAEETVHGMTADLAGSLAGSSRSATNERRKFRRK